MGDRLDEFGGCCNCETDFDGKTFFGSSRSLIAVFGSGLNDDNEGGG